MDFSKKYLKVPCEYTNCPAYNNCRRTATQLFQKDSRTEILFMGDTGHGDRYATPFGDEYGNILKALIKEINPGTSYGFSLLTRHNNEFKYSEMDKIAILDTCREFWEAHLREVSPNIIVALGDRAWKTLYPKGEPLEAARGRMFYSTKWEAVIIPMYNPKKIATNVNYIDAMRYDLFKIFNRVSVPPPFRQRTHIIKSIPEFDDFIEYAENAPEAAITAVDTETKNLNRRYGNRLGTIQFSWNGTDGYVLPYQHHETPFSPDELQHIKERLRGYFNKPRPGHFLMHNSKFDLAQLYSVLGIYVTRPVYDTQAMMYLLSENRFDYLKTPYSLKGLGREFLDYYDWDEDTLTARGKGSLLYLPLDQLAKYGATDSLLTYRLYHRLLEFARLDDFEEDLLRLLEFMYFPIFRMIMIMEYNGFYININHLRRLSSKDSPIWSRLYELEKEFYQLPRVIEANDALNQKYLDSATSNVLFFQHKQLFDINKTESQQILFFDVMGLEPVVNTKSKSKKQSRPSVGKDFAQTYKNEHPEVAMFQEYTEYKKLATSYTKSIFKMVDPEGASFYEDHHTDSHVRPSFQLTTSTGRARCSNPNTQQCPRSDSEPKKLIKSMYQAPPSDPRDPRVLVQLDFSAAEVRYLAILSKDANFAEAFIKGEQYRREYRQLADEITKEELRQMYQVIGHVKKQKCTPQAAAAELGIDFSQIEHVYTAWDRAEYEGDSHRQTASASFNIPIREVTKDQRTAAKSITFGNMFGRSVGSIAKQVGKSKEETQKDVDAFFARQKDAEKWLYQQEDFAEAHGHVRLPTGRRRRFNHFYGHNDELRAAAKRMARNSPIQGMSSDTAFLAAGLFIDHLFSNSLERDILVHNAVHDSLVYSCPKSLVWNSMHVARACFTTNVMKYMTDVWGIEFICHPEIDFELGWTWGHLHGHDGSHNHLELIFEDMEKERHLVE